MFAYISQGILIVTHNIREAVLLADKIALLAGEPATIEKEWIVPKARSVTNPLDLPIEQEELVREVYTLLNKNNNSS